MHNKINLNLKSLILNLPSSPGVYFFYDKNGKIIYIGKASVLKHRVGSYFRGRTSEYDIKTKKMISQIFNIKYQKTDSIIEALILESNLIKKYQPKYNIRERDDKSFIQIALTKEDFPRFLVIRPTEKEQLKTPIKKYWGPYTSNSAVKEILSILRKIFTYRDCSIYKFSRYQKKTTPCLFYSINLCPAPCCRYISKNEYNKIIKQISEFLDGKKKRVILLLKKQMQIESKKQNYEMAAKLRDRILAFEHINDVALIKQEKSLEQIKNIPNRIEAYDISNLGNEYAVGSMVVFTGGEIDKTQYRKFKISNKQITTNKKIIKNLKLKIKNFPKGDPQMMAQIIERRFNHPKWKLPNLIILDGGKGQLSAALRALKLKKISKLPVIAVAKGPTRKGFTLFKNNPAKRIILDRKFIENIRDEAHRFAIGYHRKLRDRI